MIFLVLIKELEDVEIYRIIKNLGGNLWKYKI